jgi:hypothetical protein
MEGRDIPAFLLPVLIAITGRNQAGNALPSCNEKGPGAIRGLFVR